MSTDHVDPSRDATELLRRGVTGDPQALVDLWATHRERLRKMVALRMDRRLRGRLDTSDVLQEAFLDFSRRIGEYGDQQDFPFFLWLRSLTIQRLLMLHRYHLGTRMRDAGRDVPLNNFGAPHASSDSLADLLLGRLTSPSQAFERIERRRAVQAALERMDSLDREILALRYFEDLSNVEAAATLGIDPSAASKRNIRALNRLRRALETIPNFFQSS